MALLKEFLSLLKGNKLLIVGHAGADIDAFSAASALREVLSAEFEAQLLFPDHINLNSKQLAKSLSIPYSTGSISLKDFDGIILVDLNEASRLGSFQEQFKETKKPVLLIDHHTASSESLALPKFSLIKEDYVSSTEILFELFKQEGFPLTERISVLLACGIFTDSVGLTIAFPRTLRIMADLLESGNKGIDELINLFGVRIDESEKIARLKAAKRARIYGIGEYLVATTEVGAFEATAANFLVRLGADIAFAGDAEKGEFRLSARASSKFLKENNFDLARDVFFELENFFKGSGGGHPGAAGFNGKTKSLSPVLKKCVELSHKFLKKDFPKAKIKEYT